MAANKANLVPVQKLVIRHGQQFMTTVYVNPNKANKVDHTKHVQVPDWKITNAQELEAEKNKIIKTKDPAEKEALKEEFLKHLKSMGITWKDNQNEAINFMRALMAAKDHLNGGGNSNPTPQPQPVSQPTPTPQPTQPSVGGTKMSKEDAKKLIKDMQKKDSVENIMNKMKAQGITWNEHTNPAVNKMRAMMALNAHFQNGGTLGGNTQQPQPTAPTPPKAPVTVQKKKVDKNAPKDGTIEADYNKATLRGKAIGLLTGMVPKDAAAENFLHKLIKDGRMNVDPGSSSGSGGEDYGLPKGMLKHLSKNGRVMDYIKQDEFNSYARPTGFAADIFKDKGTKEFEEYKKNFEDYHSKYGPELLNASLQNTKSLTDGLNVMESMGMSVNAGKTGQDYYRDLTKILSNISTSSKADIDQAWDKLGMDTFLDNNTFAHRSSTSKNSPMQHMIEFAFGGGKENLDYVKDNFMEKCGKVSWRELKEVLSDVNNGTQTKQGVFLALEAAITNQTTLKRLNTMAASTTGNINMWQRPLIPQMLDTSGAGYTAIMNLPSSYANFRTFYLKTNGSNPKSFDKTKFENFISDSITDKATLTSPEAKWVKQNLILYFSLSSASRDSYYGKYKMPENYEPVDYNDWLNSTDKLDCFKRHMAIMRKATTTRDKWRKKLAPTGQPTPTLDKQAIHDILKNGGDLSTVHLPEHKDLKGMVKCAVEKVPDEEKDTVEKKIHESHDKSNHYSFKTKVNAVYRITNLPFEEKFQEIDKARDNTGFYYHGTDYKAMQLILGKSGQFVVNKTNVKAGRMLGDGVYLAKQSSKSMQYISSGFNRGIGNKGVLFLCKASLGNAVESTVRGSGHNTSLLNRKDVDTVYMEKPHVVNPEWAVKEEKAVIPRLIIDVEMDRP